MKKKDTAFGLAATSEATSNRAGNNMDGLQPFVHYQRLLTSLLAVEGFNSSPILPTELVRWREVGQDAPSKDNKEVADDASTDSKVNTNSRSSLDLPLSSAKIGYSEFEVIISFIKFSEVVSAFNLISLSLVNILLFNL